MLIREYEVEATHWMAKPHATQDKYKTVSCLHNVTFLANPNSFHHLKYRKLAFNWPGWGLGIYPLDCINLICGALDTSPRGEQLWFTSYRPLLLGEWLSLVPDGENLQTESKFISGSRLVFQDTTYAAECLCIALWSLGKRIVRPTLSLSRDVRDFIFPPFLIL